MQAESTVRSSDRVESVLDIAAVPAACGWPEDSPPALGASGSQEAVTWPATVSAARSRTRFPSHLSSASQRAAVKPSSTWLCHGSSASMSASGARLRMARPLAMRTPSSSNASMNRLPASSADRPRTYARPLISRQYGVLHHEDAATINRMSDDRTTSKSTGRAAMRSSTGGIACNGECGSPVSWIGQEVVSSMREPTSSSRSARVP